MAEASTYSDVSLTAGERVRHLAMTPCTSTSTSSIEPTPC